MSREQRLEEILKVAGWRIAVRVWVDKNTVRALYSLQRWTRTYNFGVGEITGALATFCAGQRRRRARGSVLAGPRLLTVHLEIRTVSPNSVPPTACIQVEASPFSQLCFASHFNCHFEPIFVRLGRVICSGGITKRLLP